MYFHSAPFAVFMGLLYPLYLALRNHRPQNLALLAASYLFYGWWDWRFCGLMLASTAIAFLGGRAVDQAPDEPRRLQALRVTVTLALALLGVFKYYDFFAVSGAALLDRLGLPVSAPTLRLILPVGISFYTFHGLSYVIDIHRRATRPTADFVAFALFIAFFPLLVAGPIERATHLLPQIERPRRVTPECVYIGLHLILMGYFKKLVIADHLGALADSVFDRPETAYGLDVLAGVLAFSFQIYGDFAGYSDIARGLARLMGFEILLNFRLPYHAVSPSDFWRRWHISLSSWLRDYLYIPLGGNRHGEARTRANLMLTMLLGGLWHGAAWNFVVWGGYHGLLLVLFRRADRRELPPWSLLPRRLAMFWLTIAGWFIFRVESLPQAWLMLRHLAQPAEPQPGRWLTLLACAGPLLLMDCYLHRRGNLLAPLTWRPPAVALFHALVLLALALFARRETASFIYFQF